MTVYLWHMSALVAGAALVVATGLWSACRPGSAGVVVSRPLWFAALAAVLAALVPLVARWERAGRPTPSASTLQAALGVVATTTALSLLVLRGLHDPTWPAGIPLPPLTLLLAGLAALGVVARPRTLGSDARPSGG